MKRFNVSPGVITMIGFLTIGILCLFYKSLHPETMDAAGFLSNPYFFLVPLGMLFILLSLIIGIVIIIGKLINLFWKS